MQDLGFLQVTVHIVIFETSDLLDTAIVKYDM